jgi:signal transduction histidine kinase
LGYAPGELTGRPFLSIVHPDDRESTERCLAGLSVAERRAEFENRGLCTDGSVRQLQWGAVASSTGQIHATARDVTETRKVERQILAIEHEIQARISHNLHDGLGQTLAAITLLSKDLEDRLAKISAPETSRATKIGQLAKGAIAEARAFSLELSPIGASTGDLSTSLDAMAANARTMFDLECAFSTELGDCPFSQEVSMHVYRIAQEAVNNSIKHAHGTRVGIELERENEKLILAIVDDGVGFQPGATSQGLGLSLMRYRANQIGATLSISSAREGGTRVTCQIPYLPTGDEAG